MRKSSNIRLKTKRIILCLFLIVSGSILPYIISKQPLPLHIFSFQTSLSFMLVPALIGGLLYGPLVGAGCGVIPYVISLICFNFPSLKLYGYSYIIILFLCGFVIGILCLKMKGQKLFLKLLISLHVGIIIGNLTSLLLSNSGSSLGIAVLQNYISAIPCIIITIMIILLIETNFEKTIYG